MQNDNRVLVDVDKIRYAYFFYENQDGSRCNYKPVKPSVHGVFFDPESMAHHHPKYPAETMLKRARRLRILDIWTPVMKCELAAHRVLKFTDDKALKMWDLWKARIYNVD